ncbi:hypothetical protein F6V30_06215 [Oryzomonas sagensis]|uniref:Uncharacterized protein n=1 Tax=Oryzomonas sagensis TaxID=2603857 RepID=A0ABQ6TT41_9BACT|nr:hypothetical protein [Oryzomonas sagensis]KAB0672158.1 hypothetical protein F6V30_06215 [Oryzomonas sagensis]
MTKADKALLVAALTPEETRWATELADKLPGEVDLTFEEAKILTRIPIDRWPKRLLAKVRDVIDFGDFISDDAEREESP